ncbi:MAG: aminotransferase class IV [Patescibacteria group bacterium]
MALGKFGLADNHIGPLSETAPPASDLGRLRNWAVCTMVEARGKVFFHLEDHLQRLKKSATLAAIPFDQIEGFGSLSENLGILVEKCGFEESLVRIDISRGQTDDGFNPAAGAAPSLYAQVYRLKRKTGPVKLATRNFLRPLPEIKSPDYLFAEIACGRAGQSGFDDVLFTEDNKYILEATRSNIGFFRTDGSFCVPPPDKILEGITMKIICELIAKNNLCPRVVQAPIAYDSIAKKEIIGAILTSTTGVVPVSQIDNARFENNLKINEICSVFKDYREKYFADAK